MNYYYYNCISGFSAITATSNVRILSLLFRWLDRNIISLVNAMNMKPAIGKKARVPRYAVEKYVWIEFQFVGHTYRKSADEAIVFIILVPLNLFTIFPKNSRWSEVSSSLQSIHYSGLTMRMIPICSIFKHEYLTFKGFP